MVNIPTPVAAKDPSMCAPIAAKAQPPAQARTKPGADKDAQERKCSHTGPLKENRCGG
jgi:hypothetical protein